MKLVGQIMENVPLDCMAVSAHQLSKTSKVSLITVQRWLDIINFIQTHHIQIDLMQAKSSGGARTYRMVKRKGHNDGR